MKPYPIFSTATKNTCSVAMSQQASLQAKKLETNRKLRNKQTFILFRSFSYIFWLNFTFSANKASTLAKGRVSAIVSFSSIHLGSLQKTQAASNHKKIRLIGLIRLIKFSFVSHPKYFLSVLNNLFSVPLSTASSLRTRINTTQKITKDTFYFFREVLYYSFE